MFDFFYKIYFFFWTVTKIILIISLMALALFIVLWAIYLRNELVGWVKDIFSTFFGGWDPFMPFKEFVHDLVDRILF